MNECIRFSSAQLARLKTRLEIYKATGKGHSRPYSWIELIDQIEQCDEAFAWLREVKDTQLFGQEDQYLEETILRERADKGRPMTTNVLQKWLRGELVTRGRKNNKTRIRHFTSPSYSNLMAIYCFLKNNGFVSDIDLEEQNWPHALLACQFRDQFLGQDIGQRPAAAILSEGDYYSLHEDRNHLVVRRLTIIDHKLNDIYEIRERQMLFTQRRTRANSQTSHIYIERPCFVEYSAGWYVQRGRIIMAFLKNNPGEPEKTTVLHAMMPEQAQYNEKITFLVIETKKQEETKCYQVSFLVDSDEFFSHFRDFINRHAITAHGSKLRLLRGKNLDVKRHAGYTELYDCIGDVRNMNLQRFETLVQAEADINDRDPATGKTILHRIANVFNRRALKILIKRPDLDYLVQDDEGYYPSMVALDLDTRFAIGHFLLKKELAAARKRGVDYKSQIAAVPLTPE